MALNLIQEISVNIAATIILGLLAWGRRKFLLLFSKPNPRIPAILLFLLLLVWLLMNGLVVYLVYRNVLPNWLLASVPLLTSSLLFCFLWKELAEFWSVGLRGADREIRRGLDTRRALELCSNHLEFLGTGAAKLTREAEFEEALLRCRPDQPIRFLLSKPTHQNLTHAANRAGKDRDEFRRIVITSLKRIAEIKNQRSLNVEVRFYPEYPSFYPIFRLLFIDNSICLASYNVYGEGEGSQLPQLHVVRPPESNRVVDSFYYPFHSYFTWLWDLSQPWDFTSYI